MTRSAKIMLLGDIGVGKTSLANRFVFDQFDTDYKTTIGVNILTHDVKLPADCDDETLRFVLWDTDGDFGQALFQTSYVLGAAGAVIVADASRPGTIDHMDRLADAFEERFPGRPICCVLNKIDLVGARDCGSSSRAGRDVMRASARDNDGVAPLFHSIGAAVWRRGL
jgi:Ras-related protein Rab-5C